jgi:dolichol-phosphate mannosyltransferase
MNPHEQPPALVDDGWQVPAFRVDFERPKRTKYAVAVFVLNEGQKIRDQLQRMRPLADAADILVADGGSTDGSLTPAGMMASNVTALLVKTGPGRLSAQMRMAFAYAMRRGYEGVITVDGNGKDGVDAIPKFAKLLEEGWDHLQGSRFIPGGHHAHTPRSRLVGVRLIHAPLISLAGGFRYTDTTNGFRAYSRRFLLDPRVQPFRDVFVGYELHYYLAIRAATLAFRICEVPVSRVYPPHGKTPTKISPIRGNWVVLKTLFRVMAGAYDPART